MTNEQFAVWYASAGCLPDNMEDGPEYIGTEEQCEEYILKQEHEEVLNLEAELAQFAPAEWSNLINAQEYGPDGDQVWPSDDDIIELAEQEGLRPSLSLYSYTIEPWDDESANLNPLGFSFNVDPGESV